LYARKRGFAGETVRSASSRRRADQPDNRAGVSKVEEQSVQRGVDDVGHGETSPAQVRPQLASSQGPRVRISGGGQGIRRIRSDGIDERLRVRPDVDGAA